MTMRCRFIILFGTVGSALGILRRQEALALLSLAVLIWVFVSWAGFNMRVARLWRVIHCRRIVNGRDDGKGTLWSGRPVTIDIRLATHGSSIPPLISFRDLVPENLRLVDGSATLTTLVHCSSVHLRYRAQPLAAGRVGFAGVHAEIHEPQGLFVVRRVLRQEVRLKTLPSFASVGDVRSTVKRLNSLPHHGIHSLQRAGFGSELLELREYQPGDPPKSIAWKVSARRNRLMTRQYESEVPVRVTIIIDGTDPLREGGYGFRMLDQVAYVAASVAKAAISVGDSVGISVLDGPVERRWRMRPATGDRAFFQVLEILADFATARPPRRGRLTDGLLWTALEVSREHHPELLDERVNRPSRGTLFSWPKTHRLRRARIQLAHLLAEVYRVPGNRALALVHDDADLAGYAQRFLSDAGWAWMPPLVEDTPSIGGAASERSLAPLADELRGAVAHAHDNEVFVLFCHLVDPLRHDVDAHLEQLVPAVKLAVARHHRVVFVLPTLLGRRPRSYGPLPPTPSVRQMFIRADEIRISRAAVEIRRRLRGVGAAVGIAGEQNVIGLVMAEAELAGRGRSLRHGAAP